MYRIYLIDSDEESRKYQAIVLKNAGFGIIEFRDTQEVIQHCESEKVIGTVPDLIIVNLYGPVQKENLLKYINTNANFSKIYVVIVAANDSEVDKAKAFDLDAGDYIVKPICAMSFLARIRTLIRRSKHDEDCMQLQYKGIVLDDNRHLVLSDGNVCNLTLKEFEMLKYFLTHIGIVLNQDELLFAVWQNQHYKGNPTVRVHINNLRKKLGNQGSLIKTMRNIGYKME